MSAESVVINNPALESPSYLGSSPDLCSKVLAGIVAFMIGVVFIGGIALKIYAVQQLFQAKLDFIENAIDAKQALITPNLERLIEAKLGIKVRSKALSWLDRGRPFNWDFVILPSKLVFSSVSCQLDDFVRMPKEKATFEGKIQNPQLKGRTLFLTSDN